MFRLEKVHELGFHWEQRQDRRTEHNGLSEKTEENLDTPPACSSPLPPSPSLSFPLLSAPLLSSPLSICLWTYCYGNDTQGSLGGDQGDHSYDFRQISSVAHTSSWKSEDGKQCLLVLVYAPLVAVLVHAMFRGGKATKKTHMQPIIALKYMPQKCVESAWKATQ